jgi:hypothetical protein
VGRFKERAVCIDVVFNNRFKKKTSPILIQNRRISSPELKLVYSKNRKENQAKKNLDKWHKDPDN